MEFHELKIFLTKWTNLKVNYKIFYWKHFLENIFQKQTWEHLENSFP